MDFVFLLVDLKVVFCEVGILVDFMFMGVVVCIYNVFLFEGWVVVMVFLVVD